MRQNFLQDVTDHPALGEVEEMEGLSQGGEEFETQDFKYSNHEIMGGTERAAQQEPQKYTGEMNGRNGPS